MAQGAAVKGNGAAIKGHVDREPTKRERQVVALIVSGLGNKDIAKALRINVKTVEAHRANVYRKLQVGNTAQLIQVALSSGIAKIKGLKVA